MADAHRLFARRQRARRVVALRPVLIVAGILVVALGAGWAVLYSHWLALQSVDVRGVHLLTSRQVERAAALPSGEALVRLDLGAAGGRVEQIPAVDAVTVSRSWPHSVVITVTERTPVAFVEMGGDVRAVDATGAEFKLKGAYRGLPRLVIAPGSGALDDTAHVVGSLPAGISTRVTEVRAHSIDSITLTLRDGDEVTWGSAADSVAKAKVLAVLLHHQASRYDVSVPDQPTITP
jgi:cell division protein FtsQ